MKLIYSRWLQQTVLRETENTVVATSTFIDSLSERQAVIKANTADLKIIEAKMETLRLPKANLINPIITSLPIKGIPAYFGSGKALMQALPKDQSIIDLVLETITSLIQAETCFYQERNLADTHEDYDKYWEQVYGNTCHYYCNLSRVKRRFMENIQPYYRNNHLFCRQRAITLYQLSNNTYRLNLNLVDSFHEMSIVVDTTSQKHQVTGIWGNFVRCPDQVCKETELKLTELTGLSLIDTSPKEIIKLAGSRDGCTHLGQMLVEGVKSLQSIQL